MEMEIINEIENIQQRLNHVKNAAKNEAMEKIASQLKESDILYKQLKFQARTQVKTNYRAIYIQIGKLISELRNNLNMSQALLATAVGIDRTSIIHIEQGTQRLPIDRLAAIADILGVDITFFFKFQDCDKTVT